MAANDDTAILEETERTTGRAALRKNVQAAIALANTVRSTLGPKGLDKLLLDEEGGVQVTNDGVTVLEAARVEHPTARMMISSSSTQDRVARDGTTSTILIAAEMLQNAWDLVAQGVHPVVIANGYRMAEVEAQNILRLISKESTEESEILEATHTSLAGKGHSDIQQRIAELAVQAAACLAIEENGKIRADPTLIKILANKGGQANETHLVNGVVIAKKPAHPEMIQSRENGRILLVDGGIEKRNTVIDAKIKITEAGMLEAFRNKESEMLAQQVEEVIALGVDILVCKDGIDDQARSLLEAAGITAYRRVHRSDMDALSRAVGSHPVHSTATATEDDLGHFNSSRQEIWGDVGHWILEGSQKQGLTLVTRGSSEEMLEEVERCFADAIGVACHMHEEARSLAGGGATQIALARRLRRFAETIPGREQLAIEAYAEALEVIPRALAENAGQDALGRLLELTAAQTSTESDWLGLDLESDNIIDMHEAGIREPLAVTRQAIKGATDSAVSVLRIDDLLWAKQDPQIPEGVMDQLEGRDGD